MRARRIITVALSLIGFAVIILAATPPVTENIHQTQLPASSTPSIGSAADVLKKLTVKGRASKTGYARSQYGNGWSTTSGCDTRNIILHRDLQNPIVDEHCTVVSGILNDPYTGTVIVFTKGSSDVQIDHVVALSDAWQTGAAGLERDLRIQLANDPMELIAVQGAANQQKSDGDAATWLPSNKSFRCQYVARQIAVKQKYTLWVIPTEKQAMSDVLSSCPGQELPSA